MGNIEETEKREKEDGRRKTVQGGRRAGDYPLARVDVNVEPLYSASVTRRGDSLPRRKSSEVRERRRGDGGERVGGDGGGGGESRCGRWNKRGQRLVERWLDEDGRIEADPRARRTPRTNGRC